MQKKKKQTYFFDFDGVICDSSFEAFRILLFTSELIETPTSSKEDRKYNDFLKLRSKVGPAWNYYFVSKELIGMETVPWVMDESALEYQNTFFTNRSNFMKSNYTKWIELHSIYQNIEVILKKINNVIILTNKPSSPVREILNHFKLINHCSEIISLPETNYTTKLDFFRNQTNISGTFIDDQLETVLDCSNYLNSEINCLHANWGYHQGSVNDKSISIKELWGIIK